jgi:hypothetical protein
LCVEQSVLLNGTGTPKWHELRGRCSVDTTGFTVHCKPVTQLDPEALKALPSHDAAILEECQRAMCWLTDATLYEPSASNEPVKANITQEVLDAMLDHDKAEETMDLLGWCHVFTVPEEWKRRFRIIEACHGVNDNTELEQRTVFTSIFERHAAVLNGKWVLDLDASAYYDQFPLAEEVRRYFGFMKNGRKYRMRVLPMGVKHAVWIAQTATRQLLNFNIPSSVYTEAYIDNVRFVSDSKDDLLNAAAMFCIRAGQVGVTLNEVKVSEFMKPFEDQSPDAMNRAIALAREELERKDLAVPRANWLGEFFDYEAKTVQMSEKSRQKLEATEDLGPNHTFKQVISMFSMLLYVSRTYNHKLADYFQAKLAHSELSRLLAERPELWDEQCPEFCDSTAKSVDTWRKNLLSLPPRTITETLEPEALIVVDACGSGWGAFYVSSTSQFTVQMEWTEADLHHLGSTDSTVTEPEALYRSLCRLIPPKTRARVKVVTDPSTAQHAFPKGHSPSFKVNGIVNRFNKNSQKWSSRLATSTAP